MNKNFFKKAAVGAAVALSFSGSALAVSITNGTVSANVNASGTFSSLSYTGTEFVNWGTPMSYYALSVGGTTWTADNAGGSNPFSAGTLSINSANSATFSGVTLGGLAFSEFLQVSGSSLLVSITLFNTTSAAINNVAWASGIDPDQAIPATYDTANSILGQGTSAAVMASAVVPGGSTKSVTLRQSTGSGGSGTAYIGGYCCDDPNAATILAANQAVGFYGVSDRSIALGYDLGTIAAGQSKGLAYEYDFAVTRAVPEPETYALMMAGLGLMGFVARRRKQQSTAA